MTEKKVPVIRAMHTSGSERHSAHEQNTFFLVGVTIKTLRRLTGKKESTLYPYWKDEVLIHSTPNKDQLEGHIKSFRKILAEDYSAIETAIVATNYTPDMGPEKESIEGVPGFRQAVLQHLASQT